MANIRFLKAVFSYGKNKRFTLGGVNLYSGKQFAYDRDTIAKALLSQDRELMSEKYRIFPIRDKESGRLSIWAKGENGDSHLLRYTLDAHVAESLISQSEAVFSQFKKS